MTNIRLPACMTAHLRSTAATFLRDEAGSATLWNVTWLLVFVGFAGLAIDTTNGYRNKTLLQSTADVAALAGAMSLPDLELKAGYNEAGYPDVYESSEGYASMNMARTAEDLQANGSRAIFGDYIDSDKGDIVVGNWDFDARAFAPGGEPVNAVGVVNYLNAEERGNGVGTALMSLAGQPNWDITVEAIAARGYDRCLFNGLIARGELKMQANGSVIQGDVCLHGQLSVDITGNAQWENPGALSAGNNRPDVAANDPSQNWKVNGTHTDLNTGEDVSEAMQEPNDGDNLYPPLVDRIVELGWSMLAGIPGYRQFIHHPAEMTDAELGTLEAQPVVVKLPNGTDTIVGGTPPFILGGMLPLRNASGLWRTDRGIQVASLDGFSSVASLLGLSQSTGSGSTTMEIDYGGTQRYPADMDKLSGQLPWEKNGGYNDSDIDITAAVEVTYEEVTGSESAPEVETVTNTVKVRTPLPLLEDVEGLTISGNEATLGEKQTYFLDSCSGQPNNKGTLSLTGWVKDVTIITNCAIRIESDALVQNVILLTTDTVDQAIRIDNGAQVGSACANWGSVQMFSNGGIKTVSGPDGEVPKFFSTRMVARTDISFSAQADMGSGISMLAGGDIHVTSQATIGAVSTEEDTSGCPQTGGIGSSLTKHEQITSLVH